MVAGGGWAGAPDLVVSVGFLCSLVGFLFNKSAPRSRSALHLPLPPLLRDHGFWSEAEGWFRLGATSSGAFRPDPSCAVEAQSNRDLVVGMLMEDAVFLLVAPKCSVQDEGVLSPWRRNDGSVCWYFPPVTCNFFLSDEELNAIVPTELVNLFLLMGWLEKKLHFQSTNLPVLKFHFLLVIHGNINFVWRSCDPKLHKQIICCLRMSASWIEDDKVQIDAFEASIENCHMASMQLNGCTIFVSSWCCYSSLHVDEKELNYHSLCCVIIANCFEDATQGNVRTFPFGLFHRWRVRAPLLLVLRFNGKGIVMLSLVKLIRNLQLGSFQPQVHMPIRSPGEPLG